MASPVIGDVLPQSDRALVSELMCELCAFLLRKGGMPLRKLGIVRDAIITSMSQAEDEEAHERCIDRVLQAILSGSRDCIGEFVRSSPWLSAEKRDVALGWEAGGVYRTFVVAEHGHMGSVLVDASATKFGVVGLETSLRDRLVLMGYTSSDILCVRTCILPYKSRIIWRTCSVMSPVVSPISRFLAMWLSQTREQWVHSDTRWEVKKPQEIAECCLRIPPEMDVNLFEEECLRELADSSEKTIHQDLWLENQLDGTRLGHGTAAAYADE